MGCGLILLNSEAEMGMESTNSLLDQLQVSETVSAASFRLSVLVTVFNERHLVEANLRRVLALDDELISSLQVIVVDLGSKNSPPGEASPDPLWPGK